MYGPGAIDEDLPYNATYWEDRWGFIATDPTVRITAALMIGEYGSFNETDWFNELIDYLIDINQRNNIFFALNPGGITGGILDFDWTTPDIERLDLLNRLQPFPTLFTYDDNNNLICYENISNNEIESIENVVIQNRPMINNETLAFVIDIFCGIIDTVEMMDNALYIIFFKPFFDNF